MADRIRGITIEIGGDTTKLSQALKGVNTDIKNTQNSLKDVERLLKLDPKNTELLRQKQVLLKQAIEQTTSKLETLHTAEKQLAKAGVDKNSEQFMALKREIAATEAEQKKLKDETKNATKSIDDNTKAAKDNKSAMEGLKTAAAAAGKAMAAVGAAAVTGVAALTKSAVQGYADYEQLVGGVETLFGENADAVVKHAQDAFQSAGLSANAYMETVTSFSASLIQSLDGDTAAAADVADRAIRDMSDNANKLGTDMSSIQNAYQGFAKQNYTMLDNLKLGYGGTKEEMERLIKDAAALTDVQDELNVTVEEGDLSFSNIVNAISVMQKRMGIANATAEEAAGTISGSAKAVSAAWQNLVTGIADPDADLGHLIENLVTAASDAIANLLPAISQALEGIGMAIEKLAPVIAQELPKWIETLLPSLLDAVIQLIDSLANNLPAILDALIPVLIQLVKDIVARLPSLLQTVIELVTALIKAIADAIPELIPVIVETVVKLIEVLTDPSNIAMLIGAGITLILAVCEGILKALPQIMEALAKSFVSIKDVLKKIDWSDVWKGIVDAAKGCWEGIKGVFNKVGDFFRDTFSKAWEKVTKVFSVAGSIFTDIKDGIVTAFKKIVNGLIEGINKVISKPFEGINKALDKIREINILGAQPFKNLASVQIPKIPLLAKGGILSSGSAIVGEAGPELLTMLGNRAMVQPLTTNNNTTNNNNTVDAPVTINIYGERGQDVNALADVVARRIQLHVNQKMGAY